MQGAAIVAAPANRATTAASMACSTYSGHVAGTAWVTASASERFFAETVGPVTPALSRLRDRSNQIFVTPQAVARGVLGPGKTQSLVNGARQRNE